MDALLFNNKYKKKMKKVKYINEPKSWLGKIKKFLKLLKYEDGLFHQFGFSGHQKENQPDILIIEQQNGQIITIKKNSKNYKFI